MQLAAEKGLANYDKSNKYETLLKDIVNASKYTLSDVDDIIDADPLLGPILGPSESSDRIDAVSPLTVS